MKKLVLSVVLLAGLSFVACSKDDDGGSPALADCVTCTITSQGMEIEQDICEEDFETRAEYEQFVSSFEQGGGDCVNN